MASMAGMRFEPYQEFLAEREELLRHKWLMSEQHGMDIGFESALIDWARAHRATWRQQRNQMLRIDAAAIRGSAKT